MTYNDLSPSMKRRFKTAKCFCCLKPITELEFFETLEMKYKRIKVVAFVHSDCIVKVMRAREEGSEHGEVKEEQRIES